MTAKFAMGDVKYWVGLTSPPNPSAGRMRALDNSGKLDPSDKEVTNIGSYKGNPMIISRVPNTRHN
jgi:hypothetical protein